MIFDSPDFFVYLYEPVPFVAAVTFAVCELVLYVFVIVWFSNVNSFAVAVDATVVAAFTAIVAPVAVFSVPPIVSFGVLYPVFASDFAHIFVPFNTAVFAFTSVPVELLVESTFVVNFVPFPWLLVTKYEVIVAASLTFPAASFAQK